MHAIASRFYGYITMVVFAVSRVRRLGDAQLRLQLHRQIHSLGIAALPVTIALAALTGTVAMTQASALLGQDNDSVERLLFYGLFFELAPLLCALLVVARSSPAIASELAVMHLHNEFTALRRMGVGAADFLLLPRIWGLMLALPALTVIFQGICIGSGWLAAASLHNQSLGQVAGRFLDFSNPWLLLACVAKSTAMGAIIGAIACHHGTSAKRSPHAISDAAIHSVGNGLVAVFLVDIAFISAIQLLQ